ncbi:uncharacterized protein RCO7_08873 [Rhynchosporium graminicola]|uniref:Uncharacterized protein n=1 Tax=Rhynchosporium graminicola TaxID=2792576 RepID=A0A1E1KJA2_9HELO|nr:uncharacterized protein RCO7_08873 [Rhynchosporium commune]
MAQRNPIGQTESLSATGRGNEPIGTGTAYESSTAGTTTHSSTTGGGAAGGVKGVLAGIHGVGEKIRGEFNKGVDGAMGDKEGVLKNEQVANAGDRERLTGTFAGETKNREGALPGADGDKRY